MPKPTAAVQLIVFGERNKTDIAGVLKDVATAGFPAIEAGNLYETYGEQTIRDLLTANDLIVAGAHFGYGDYAEPARVAAHIAYAKSIGVTNLMCSGVANTKTAEGYKVSARVFNEVGSRLKDEGLIFNYHNHAWEFDDLGGVNGMQILADETDSSLVKFNLDIFWLFYAGKDPAAFIESHADRAGYFHFKDGRKVVEDGKVRPEFLELGRGDVDLESALQAAASAGATWIVAEQDRTTLPQLESVTISRAYLKQLGV